MLEQKHIDIICGALGISEADITNIKVNRGGFSNFTYVVSISDGNKYLYRIPGPRTEIMCDRHAEYVTHKLLAPYKFTQEIKYFDTETGIMLCYYYPVARPAKNEEHDLKCAADMIRMFHSLPIKLELDLSNTDRIARNEKLFSECGGRFSDEYYSFIEEKYPLLIAEYEKHKCAAVPSTGDFTPGNILFVEGGKVVMIDLEYTANADPYTDISIFVHDMRMSDEDALHFLSMYLERTPSREEELKLFLQCAFTGLRWYTWAMCKMALGGKNEFYEDFADFSIKYAYEHFNVVQSYLR